MLRHRSAVGHAFEQFQPASPRPSCPYTCAGARRHLQPSVRRMLGVRSWTPEGQFAHRPQARPARHCHQSLGAAGAAGSRPSASAWVWVTSTWSRFPTTLNRSGFGTFSVVSLTRRTPSLLRQRRRGKSGCNQHESQFRICRHQSCSMVRSRPVRSRGQAPAPGTAANAAIVGAWPRRRSAFAVADWTYSDTFRASVRRWRPLSAGGACARPAACAITRAWYRSSAGTHA